MFKFLRKNEKIIMWIPFLNLLIFLVLLEKSLLCLIKKSFGLLFKLTIVIAIISLIGMVVIGEIFDYLTVNYTSDNLLIFNMIELYTVGVFLSLVSILSEKYIDKKILVAEE